MILKRKIINIIVDFLIKYNVITQNETDKYQYIIEIVWLIIVPFLMIIPINIIVGTTFEGYLLLISFTILRRFCGGYHFKNEKLCYLMSSVLLLDFLLIGKTINKERTVWILIIASFISLIVFSIINAELSKKKVYFLEIVIVNIFVGIFEIGFTVTGNMEYSKWITLGTFMTALLQYPVTFDLILSFKDRK